MNIHVIHKTDNKTNHIWIRSAWLRKLFVHMTRLLFAMLLDFEAAFEHKQW